MARPYVLNDIERPMSDVEPSSGHYSLITVAAAPVAERYSRSGFKMAHWRHKAFRRADLAPARAPVEVSAERLILQTTCVSIAKASLRAHKPTCEMLDTHVTLLAASGHGDRCCKDQRTRSCSGRRLGQTC